MSALYNNATSPNVWHGTRNSAHNMANRLDAAGQTDWTLYGGPGVAPLNPNQQRAISGGIDFGLGQGQNIGQNMIGAGWNQLQQGRDLMGGYGNALQGYQRGAAGLPGAMNRSSQMAGGLSPAMGYFGATARGYGQPGAFQNQGADLNMAAEYADNPFMTGMIDAASRDVTRNLYENQLPGIAAYSAGSGNLGSSRRGMQEAIAQRGAADRIGDIASGLRGDSWRQGLGYANQIASQNANLGQQQQQFNQGQQFNAAGQLAGLGQAGTGNLMNAGQWGVGGQAGLGAQGANMLNQGANMMGQGGNYANNMFGNAFNFANQRQQQQQRNFDYNQAQHYMGQQLPYQQAGAYSSVALPWSQAFGVTRGPGPTGLGQGLGLAAGLAGSAIGAGMNPLSMLGLGGGGGGGGVNMSSGLGNPLGIPGQLSFGL